MNDEAEPMAVHCGMMHPAIMTCLAFTCWATVTNKHASSNKKLLVTSATLLGTSALLVVTMFAIFFI